MNPPMTTSMSRAGRMPAILFLMCLAIAGLMSARADTTLVSAGSVWRFLDNGTDQGTA